jgi:hypothetical protein
MFYGMITVVLYFARATISLGTYCVYPCPSVCPSTYKIQLNLAQEVTCIKRSPFSCRVIENFIWIEPLLRGHLSYRPLFFVQKVTSWYRFDCICFFCQTLESFQTRSVLLYTIFVHILGVHIIRISIFLNFSQITGC